MTDSNKKKKSWADEVDDSDESDYGEESDDLCNIEDLEDLDENDLKEIDESIYEMDINKEIDEHKRINIEIDNEIEKEIINKKIENILDNLKIEIGNKFEKVKEEVSILTKKNKEPKLNKKESKEDNKEMKIVYYNNSKIKIKIIDDMMKEIEDVKIIDNNRYEIKDSSEDKKYRDMYHYVTGRIKMPFNQFNKMIRIDYHYNERRLQIYRIYTVMNKDEFEKIYIRIVDDFTEELFKTCFIDDNKLYIPFLYSEQEGKYYDMLKYIKSNKEYELLLYVINF